MDRLDHIGIVLDRAFTGGEHFDTRNEPKKWNKKIYGDPKALSTAVADIDGPAAGVEDVEILLPEEVADLSGSELCGTSPDEEHSNTGKSIQENRKKVSLPIFFLPTATLIR